MREPFIPTLFTMLFLHALADYPLQGEFLATYKARRIKGLLSGHLWVHALLAHSLIHAGMVLFVTSSMTLALAELVAHALIDFSKCEGWINYHVDQALHVACKVLWLSLLAWRLV